MCSSLCVSSLYPHHVIRVQYNTTERNELLEAVKAALGAVKPIASGTMVQDDVDSDQSSSSEQPAGKRARVL